MDNQPLVSIITPTYNHSQYIVDCIKSVEQQSYPNWEMLIVDDGSTDHTAEVVEQYILGKNNIKLFKQSNVGIFRLGETYNFALSRAEGKYIAILEGDDVWMSDKLERQVKAMEHDSEVVLAWGSAYSSNSDLSENYNLHPDSSRTNQQKYYNNKPTGCIMNIFFFYNCIPALTILIRKETLLKIGGFTQPFNLPLIDLPTLFEMAGEGSFYFDEKPLGKWRLYSTQVTKTYPAQITEGFYQLALLHYNKNNKSDKKINFNFAEADIHKYYKSRMIIDLSRAGRYKLIRKQYAEARIDYLKSIFGYGFSQPVWKIRSIIGYVFSLFHINVEWLAKLIGNAHYNKK